MGTSDVLAARGEYPGAEEVQVVAGNVDEAEAGPDLARHSRLIGPEFVCADHDRVVAALRVGELEAELVQPVAHQRLVQDQQHAGFRQVAQVPDDRFGHRVEHIGGLVDLAPLGPAVFAAHAPAPASGTAKERSALRTSSQARSITLPLCSSATAACPLATRRARPSMLRSVNFCPRWLTNSVAPVALLNQARRRLTFSPCGPMNSKMVPAGISCRRSSVACSVDVSGMRLVFFACMFSPRRVCAFRRSVSSVRLLAASSSSLVLGLSRRRAIALTSLSG